MSTQPHILMCPPEFYGVEYEINPWMDKKRDVDHGLAQQQWDGLHDLLTGLGARVSLLTPEPHLPDLVFTANAALIYRQRAILARFRHWQRRGEVAIDHDWLVERGFSVEHLPSELYFEGAGDALFCGDTLFAGYRIRSDARSHQQIGELLGHRVIPLELVDPYFYHLDTCFCPLSTDTTIYHPAAFDEYGRKVIPELIDTLIEVEQDEARHFACNAVVVGNTIVTNTGCPKLHGALQARGFETAATPLSEFVKAGGSAKCLTLRLDGEEAAGWKY